MGSLNRQPLEGRRALVTGGSRGIGLASAAALAQMGAAVAVAARDPDSLDRAIRTLGGDAGRHLGIGADLTTGAGVAHCKAELEGWGPPHVVVANLNTATSLRRFSDLAPGSLAQAVSENLDSLAAIAPAALECQRRDRFGRWIAISSAAARLGGPGQGAYVGVKGALEALMRTIAVEEGAAGITANTVVAGLVDTEGVRAAVPPGVFDRLGRMNVIGRPARPDEVAHAVAYLAHPLAGYVTGTTVTVAGGSDLLWELAPRREDGDGR